MKTQVLATVGLGAFLLLSGCGGGGSNANVATTNRTNTNMAAGNTTVVTTNANTSSTPMIADAATKTVVEAALKKNNFSDVTVEATTGSGSVTLRGSVPKGKMAEAVRVAQEAGRKPVDNQLREK